MKKVKFEKINRIIVFFLILVFAFYTENLSAQQATSQATQAGSTSSSTSAKVAAVSLNNFAYSFINFNSNYATTLGKLKSGNYNIEEKEISSINGKFFIYAEKKLNFLKEKLYLYFDYQKNLIYFLVSFECEDAYTRAPLEKLYSLLIEKLNQKYGESENKDLGYYKMSADTEVCLLPIVPFKNSLEIWAKNKIALSKYQDDYKNETQKPITTEITTIVNGF